MTILWKVLVAVTVCQTVKGMPVQMDNDGGLSLRIVHTNDMHARFEETSKYSSTCAKKDSEAGKCYGGFARLATLIRQARNSTERTLFLNAGDTYQGTIWYTVHKWRIVSRFLNLLAPDAISLGNHEFDDGIAGLVPFLKELEFPVVTANLDLSMEPSLRLPVLRNSTVFEISGHKIGVIGYLTPDTKVMSSSGNVIFRDEVEAIREEVARLKSEGVKIFIALGHSGYSMDKRIAKEVADIDLVIGGHTNTFLYNGQWPDFEIPDGLYPTEVVQESGRKTYVVQAYAYTKYLGNLSLQFDQEGEITRIEGSPILVDGRIEQAPDILEELDKWRKDIDQLTYKTVGSTKVLLDGDVKSCRLMECNLGNLIADAMIDYYVQQQTFNNAWTDAAIALHNGGSIRTSITRDNDDKITMGDVLAVLPFGNVLFSAELTGKKIVEMLEWSVYHLDDDLTNDPYGSYLQVSGLHVVYDLTKPHYSRVVSVQVQCASCIVPSYHEIQMNDTYKILMNDFLYNGGDGYQMIKGAKFTSLGITIAEVLSLYLNKTSPVYPAVEGRIIYADENFNSNPSQARGSAPFIYPTLISVLIFLKTVFLVR